LTRRPRSGKIVLMSKEYTEIAKNCACFNFRRASRAVTTLFNQTLRPTHLTSSQFVALLVLALQGQMRMSDMAEFLGVERSTLTRVLAPLKKRKFITIIKSESDKRTRMVSLLGAGKKHLDHSIPYWRKAQANITDLFGGQWNTMLDRLGKASSVSSPKN
jgi:DNA-binding MarR family transcriptional regulator